MAKPQLYLAISNDKPVIPLFAKKANLRLVFGNAHVQGVEKKTEDAPKQKPLLAPNRHDHYPH